MNKNKRAYSSPALVDYGSIAKLTQGRGQRRRWRRRRPDHRHHDHAPRDHALCEASALTSSSNLNCQRLSSLLLGEHRGYLADVARLRAFERAIQLAVSPGDSVLDLGSGTGVLGLFALRAGARHVYAVDSSPMAGRGPQGPPCERRGRPLHRAPPALAHRRAPRARGRGRGRPARRLRRGGGRVRGVRRCAAAPPQARRDAHPGAHRPPARPRRLDGDLGRRLVLGCPARRTSTSPPSRRSPATCGTSPPCRATTSSARRCGSRAPTRATRRRCRSAVPSASRSSGPARSTGVAAWFEAHLADGDLDHQRARRRPSGSGGATCSCPSTRRSRCSPRVQRRGGGPRGPALGRAPLDDHGPRRRRTRSWPARSHSSVDGTPVTREDLARGRPDATPGPTPAGAARQTVLALCDGATTRQEIEAVVAERHAALLPDDAAVSPSSRPRARHRHRVSRMPTYAVAGRALQCDVPLPELPVGRRGRALVARRPRREPGPDLTPSTSSRGPRARPVAALPRRRGRVSALLPRARRVPRRLPSAARVRTHRRRSSHRITLRHLIIDQLLPHLLVIGGALVLHASCVGLDGERSRSSGPPGSASRAWPRRSWGGAPRSLADDYVLLDQEGDALPGRARLPGPAPVGGLGRAPRR